MAAQQPQPNMEDILSSIRSTMEEEVARTGPSEDGEDSDVLVLENELTDEEILALAETDLLDELKGDETAGEDEGLIDLAAFTSTGAMKATDSFVPDASDDILGINLPVGEEPVSAAAEQGEMLPENDPETELLVEAAPDDDDAFDKLMNELKQDKDVSHAQRVEELLADDEPAAEVPDASSADNTRRTDDTAARILPETTTSTRQIELPALTGASGGLQVAFPAEVLAEALRPLISQWLTDNLPVVVERLVQQEIKKLMQQ